MTRGNGRVTAQHKALDLDVLLIDDDKRLRTTLRIYLQGLGCRVEEADSAPAVRAALQRASFQLVILDVRLGAENGLDLLPLLRAQVPAPSVVVISAFVTIALAVQAAQLGARACLPKPFVTADVQALVEQVALERAVDDKMVEQRQRLGPAQPELDLLTESPRMLQALDIVTRVAPHDTPVLLRGQRGTGKATVARRLHALSLRAGAPFVTVCGRGLSEDALLGRLGTVLGGTLFLDDLGELTPRLQARLLQLLLESRDVRVVTATSHMIEREVEAGRFRADLCERLRPFEIAIPSLQERREDILPLARRLLAFYSRHAPVKAPELSLAAESALLGYPWPGNLRELAQAMERAAVLRVGTRVDVEALPEAVTAPAARVPQVGGAFSLDAIEREHILRVLATAPTLEEASRILGIDTSTLWRKRKRYQT
jgi:NtrC-family two-component system response regulator AlgB